MPERFTPVSFSPLVVTRDETGSMALGLVLADAAGQELTVILRAGMAAELAGELAHAAPTAEALDPFLPEA